ncbi:MAG: 3,4-dihydroxy-2-butanone-4-phosphate synthase [Pseudomonadota bacterium]
MSSDLDNFQKTLAAFKAGDIVIVTDDDDRENEGDLIVAGSLCTPEKMAFIIRHTSGIICAPVTADEAKRLHLNPMVAANDAPLGTAFTISVDVRHGLTTGISAEERTNTIRALANNNIGAGDFVRPGHVFPLIARQGGVLMRSGHTEAAVDLCQLCELPAVAAIGELMNDDGSVMHGADIKKFAVQHKLPVITVADLISYRQAREKLVERVGELNVETPIGMAKGVIYKTPFDSVEQLALVFGDIGGGKNIPARLHRQNILDDIFGNQERLQATYARFQVAGGGVLVYLREGAAGVPSTHLAGTSTSDTSRSQNWHEVGLGAQILRDLGVSSIRLISSRPMRYVGLEGFGITIAETEMVK